MPRFEIGDRVVCIDNFESDDILGKSGKIVKIRGSSVGVDFDKRLHDGHDCDGYARFGHGWFVEVSCLKLEVKKPRIIKQYGITKFWKEVECGHFSR